MQQYSCYRPDMSCHPSRDVTGGNHKHMTQKNDCIMLLACQQELDRFLGEKQIVVQTGECRIVFIYLFKPANIPQHDLCISRGLARMLWC